MDLIDRHDAIDALMEILDRPNHAEFLYTDEICKVLNELPSVQPDIIVCADCKHWVCHDKRCGYWNHGVQPLMWCSQAERRTDGEIIPE